MEPWLLSTFHIGGELFRRLREEKRYYVDKTGLIEELFSANQPLVSLITRPRRFGKTLAMTMLQEFFDIQKDSRQIFEGLAVSRNARLCDEWMNHYPVVFLSLKNVEGQNFPHARDKYALLISRICAEHNGLFTSRNVGDEILEKLILLKRTQADASLLEDSLLLLCRALEAHWGKPAILLIDEYDVPINHSEQNGYYNEMIGFMRNLLGAALKTNASLKFAVLTGCIRIARENIFTGLNNFVCYSVSDTEYADMFGFTEAEVDRILADAKLSDKKPEFKEWYDGYRFGTNTEIYCPWDILTHLARLQKKTDDLPQAYWRNTGGNAIVRTLLAQSGKKTRTRIEALIEGKAVEENLAEDLTYDLVYKNENNIWSMLYLTGYLTKAPVQPGNGNTALVIPNREIREIFTTTVTAWFNESIGKQDLSPFVKAIWNGDAPAIQEALTRILYSTISYYDSSESFYQGFMAGLFNGTGLDPESNHESGLGRTDITIEDGLHKRAVIIELKYSHEYEELEKKAEEALSQIERKKYAASLPPHIRTVLTCGIAFWKKECCVKTASHNLSTEK
ncbi:MAG: ATP-binding protein [Desulfovibrio sp.]|nr:ATP-binding protein [Desulfovibrio sp.]